MINVSYPNIVCLMYDIIKQAVSLVCMFMSKLEKHHYEVVKWTFKYLKDTRGPNTMFRSEHSDPSVAGNDIIRSIIRYVFTLVRWPICGKLSVEFMLLMSIIKYEYMEAGKFSMEDL